MFLSLLNFQTPIVYRTGFWVLATALVVVVGLVTRVMVLGDAKGGLFVSSSPFDLIWLQLLADCDKDPFTKEQKGRTVNEKKIQKKWWVFVMYISWKQSIKMHVISMMPWQAGRQDGSLESGQCKLQALLVHRLENWWVWIISFTWQNCDSCQWSASYWLLKHSSLLLVSGRRLIFGLVWGI